jgi:glucosylceramidase
MKTNNNIQGGRLKEEYYPTYAKYFVKYVEQMKAHGIIIDAITIQNEPFNDGNTPSMQLFAKEELRFIKNHLGPAFKSAGIKTKIILYDHNCDAPEYPISILTDSVARKYIDGSGFHLYAGPIAALTKVHNAFPDKHLYFTEMMAVSRNDFNTARPVERIVIGASRNWSRNVILWNLAADQFNKPHTDNGGCGMCQGAVTIDGDKVSRNLAYYTIGHASKFVPDGSTRIESSIDANISNVAFSTADGKIVLIVANNSKDR